MPLVFHYGVLASSISLQGAYATVVEAEINELSAQARAHPQRSYLSLHLLEDEDASPFLWVKPRAFHNAYQCIRLAVAVDIARTEAIDGIRQPPLIEMIEAVVLFSQAVSLRPPS